MQSTIFPNSPIKYGSIFASFITSFSGIMSSSRGRDKICAMIQHIAELYETCKKQSDYIPNGQMFSNENDYLGIRVASKIQEQMSKARKIFRFLKFIQILRNIPIAMKSNKHWLIKLIILKIGIAKFFYYLLDNLLWGINIGVLSDVVPAKTEMKFGIIKNSFHLAKVYLNIFKYIVCYIRRKRKQSKLLANLDTKNEKIIVQQFNEDKISQETIEFQTSLLKQKRKLRIETINLVVSVLKSLVLQNILHFPIIKKFNPTFISCCSVTFTFITIIKQFYKKKLIELKFSKNQQKRNNKVINIPSSESLNNEENNENNLNETVDSSPVFNELMLCDDFKFIGQAKEKGRKNIYDITEKILHQVDGDEKDRIAQLVYEKIY